MDILADIMETSEGIPQQTSEADTYGDIKWTSAADTCEDIRI